LTNPSGMMVKPQAQDSSSEQRQHLDEIERFLVNMVA
jgi:hypothetical protein